MKCHVRTKRCGKKKRMENIQGKNTASNCLALPIRTAHKRSPIRPASIDQYMFVEIFGPFLDTKFGMFCASESEKQSLHCDEAAGSFQLRVASCLH